MAYTKINCGRSGSDDKYVPKKDRAPLIRGKEAKTNAGFQENISREKDLGKGMKQAVAIAYGEADDALKNAHAKVKHAHSMAKKYHKKMK